MKTPFLITQATHLRHILDTTYFYHYKCNMRAEKRKDRKMLKKVLSILVVVTLMFSMMPSGVVLAATVKRAKITSVKASSSTGKVTVKWKKVKKAKGYQVKISKKKSGKSVVYKKTTKKRKLTSKKLSNGTYYVRVRAFKKVSGKKKYGKWSKAKKVTVKVTSSTSSNSSGVDTSTGESGDSYDNSDYQYDDSSSETINPETLDGNKASVSFADGEATISEDATGISVNESSGVTTVSISTAGVYTLSGTATNTKVEVAKGLDETTLVLDNLTVDNSSLASTENKDSSFIAYAKNTNGTIILSGTNTIKGSSTYVSEPAAIISQKGDAPTLTISQTDSKDGVLNIVDNMDSDTDFGDVDPADGIATKGELIIKSGSINATTNGDCLKGTGSDGTGGVTIDGGVMTLKSNQSSGIKSKNGNITINDGKININYSGGDAIKATNYYVYINSGETTIDN